MAKAWIGTSGWQYPDFNERFYPKTLAKTAQLSFYSSEFPTVEVNNTFYHLPREATVTNCGYAWENAKTLQVLLDGAED